MAAKGITKDDVADTQLRDGGIMSEAFGQAVQKGFIYFILKNPKERQRMLDDTLVHSSNAGRVAIKKSVKNIKKQMDYHKKIGKPMKRFGT